MEWANLENQQRLISMKPAGLKRFLFVLLLMCGVLVFYLFWNQENPPIRAVEVGRSVLSTKRRVFISEDKLNPIWTWKCNNQKCERRLLQKNGKPTSMATCNMLCGSTQLWPQPTGPVSLGSRSIAFRSDQITFETELSGAVQKLLSEALASFKETVSNTICPVTGNSPSSSDISEFKIKIKLQNPNEIKLKLNTDESYHLTLRLNKTTLVGTIDAATFFGARHGLETLSQLIWWDEFASGGTLKILTAASIIDAPKFSYRGIMLDTSRHFFPVSYIKRTIVGMSANKLNTFHWHITDSQSFPFKSPSVPQFAEYGAYGPNMVYTAEDVKEIVDFASTKGIRVVIEIDTPAHSGNGWTWGPNEGLGDLAVCVNKQPWNFYCGEPPCGQLNPQNPNTYDVLEKLYRDILELTRETEIFHIGGDEVNLECWSQHLNWGGSYANYTDLHDVWGEFTLKIIRRLENANKGISPSHIVIWSSNLSKRPFTTKYLDKNKIVVQVWGPVQWPDTVDLLLEGYRVILSHVDAWYLDCGFGRWRETGEAACDPYRPWQSVYNHRPWQQHTVNISLILGGEVCLWTEQVDPKSLDSRLWPRAAAFAERVWSDPNVDLYAPNIGEDVYTRLGTQRDRMVQRGFDAEAMWPKWCTQNPGMCL